MKNKILFISLAVVLVVSLALVGCGGEQEEEEELTLDYYTMYPPDYVYITHAYPAIVGQIEENSENCTSGPIQVEIHWSQELGPTMEAATIIGTGVADFGHCFAPQYPESLPLTNMAGLPLAAGDPRIIQDALMACLANSTAVGDDLAGEWEALNLIPMQLFPFVWPNTLWGDGNNVTTVADLDGRKVLMTGEYPSNAIYEAHNATVIVRTMHEAYEALQTNLVDSMSLTCTSIVAYSIYEQVTWGVTNNGLFTPPMTIVFCKDTWDDLSSEHQDIIWNAFWDHRYAMAEAALAATFDSLTFIADYGVDLIEWSEEELDLFKAPAWDIWDDYITDWDCEDFALEFVRQLELGGASPPWP